MGEAVIDEVLQSAAELCCDEYGKFALEELLDKGLPQQRARVVSALKTRLIRNAKHEHASFLIQRVLRHGGDDATDMVQELLASPQCIRSLIKSQFGRYVLGDLAQVENNAQKVRYSLLPFAMELGGS